MFITLGRRQKIHLFLFFMTIMVFAFFYSNVIGKSIEGVHSEYIIGSLKDYKKMESENFTLYYRQEDSQYTKDILRITKEMMEKVENNLSVSHDKDFHVVLYPNSIEMNAGLSLPSEEKTLGAYYGGNIFLLSPSQLQLENSSMGNIILHEYTHLLVEDITGGNHPVWFTEGMALYQEYWITGYEWGQEGEVVYVDLPYTIDQLEEYFYQLDTFKSYGSSFLFIKFLNEEYGKESMDSIMKEMGTNRDYHKAIEKAIGKNMQQLETEFILWYNR